MNTMMMKVVPLIDSVTDQRVVIARTNKKWCLFFRHSGCASFLWTTCDEFGGRAATEVLAANFSLFVGWRRL
jgi:hypothetical protein